MAPSFRCGAHDYMRIGTYAHMDMEFGMDAREYGSRKRMRDKLPAHRITVTKGKPVIWRLAAHTCQASERRGRDVSVALRCRHERRKARFTASVPRDIGSAIESLSVESW